jgi:beta-phosphoglucomutase-like phosphatase (HAD superfamily)
VKLIVFDFDGTLVDSRSLILESHRIVFSEFGLPLPPPADSLALVGKTLDLILAQLAGPAAPIRDMVRAYDLLLPKLRADPAFAERPFDGIADLFARFELGSPRGAWNGHRAHIRNRCSGTCRTSMARLFSNHPGRRHGAFQAASCDAASGA